MKKIANKLVLRLITRRCRCCASAEYHTHHLTWFGRWRFRTRIWRRLVGFVGLQSPIALIRSQKEVYNAQGQEEHKG